MATEREKLVDLTAIALYERHRSMCNARSFVVNFQRWEQLPEAVQRDWHELAYTAVWACENNAVKDEETAHARQLIDSIFASRGIKQTLGPAMAFFAVGEPPTQRDALPDSNIVHHQYLSISARGKSISAARAEFVDLFVAAIPADAKAAVWRKLPIAECGTVMESGDVVFFVRARVAFLSDAADLERIIYEDDMP